MYKQYFISFVFFLSFAFSSGLFSQDSVSEELAFEVTKVYPSLSLTKDELSQAECLSDLSRYYEASWVKEYESVEISVIKGGTANQVFGKSEVISAEQKDLMHAADLGSQIEVTVSYLPENNLKINDLQEIKFMFYVEPDHDAKFIGELNSYIKTHAIDQIPSESFVEYDMAAVKFTVDPRGNIVNIKIFQSSNDEEIDALLLKTISDMPAWQPAKYADGTPAVQEFALIVGSKENCMTNLLNIHRD